MKLIESALLLVIGSVLVTFAGISLALFPRPFTLANPTLLVEAFGIAGLVLAGLGARGIYRVQCILQSAQSRPEADSVAA